jgi:hypothetical protein
MKKIGFVICFFGELPWYFNFFIKSCIHNPTIDFIIFTDNNIANLPQNIRTTHFTLSDFNQLASERLGFEIKVKSGYKICDIRPAFGEIFSEYLLNYDFWGFCDIDIVFGNIRGFITDNLLEQHDIVSSRHDYITGSFLLFKNAPQINGLFKNSKDYHKVFTSDVHFCFDECNFKHSFLENEISIFDVACDIESMEHVIRKEYEQNNINVFFDYLVVDGLPGKLEWNNGELFYDNKFEILLYHMIRYKDNYYSKKVFWKNIPNVFFIDQYTFREKSMKSMVGFFEFYFYKKVIPFKFRVIHRIDFLISNICNGKLVHCLKNGRYKNKLGESFFEINEEENTMSNPYLGTKGKLIKSRFKKEVFYLKGFPMFKYKYINSPEGIIQKIQSIQIADGAIKNYELIKILKTSF